MASAELGDRDAFGLKLGPAGAVVQIFQMRRGRVVERIELVSEAAADGAAPGGGAEPGAGGMTDGDVLQAALQQFYAERAAPPEIHVPLALRGRRRRDARRLAVRRGRTARPARRPAARREARAARPRLAQRRSGLPGAVQRERRRQLRRARDAAGRPRPAVGAAPHRLLRHLDDPGQRDRRVDGRLRGRPHEAVRVPQVPDPRQRPDARSGQRRRPAQPGRAAAARRRRARCPRPRAGIALPERLRGDARGRPAGATASCSSRGGRSPT